MDGMVVDAYHYHLLCCLPVQARAYRGRPGHGPVARHPGERGGGDTDDDDRPGRRTGTWTDDAGMLLPVPGPACVARRAPPPPDCSSKTQQAKATAARGGPAAGAWLGARCVLAGAQAGASRIEGANSLNDIKILANSLIAIDPTYHRHKKIPSMPFSGIQEIGENFNGIQGIDSTLGPRSQPLPGSTV